jgi:hypothetical protein
VQKGTAGVGEARGSLQHVAVDLVTAPGIGVDGSPAVDQGVEERKAARQRKPLRPDLEHQERRIPGGLDVKSDELGGVERGVGPGGRELIAELLPEHRLHGPARLQVDRAASFGGQYAFLWVQTRARVIRRILMSNARLQFSM